ncbi:MAG TPA: hypothetical protein VH372_03510 [Actinospica sp.]|jgi:hypothetical protein|nr:hypothetical protein [Actinospica sp.]
MSVDSDGRQPAGSGVQGAHETAHGELHGEPPTAPAAASPGRSTAPQRPRPIGTRYTPLIIALVVVLVLAIAAGIWHAVARHGNVVVGTASQGSVDTTYSTAGVETLNLEGINGSLNISVGSAAQIGFTAAPVNGSSAPSPVFRLNDSTHVLTLTCEGYASCPATDYSVVVPEHVGVTLHELSGQATLTGLSGPVDISASSANTTVEGLRSADFTAVITSGTLTATFAQAPAEVNVSVTSAQASLHLPGTTDYNVIQQAVSGNIQDALPQSAVAAHTVRATATSGEINLATD